MQTGPAGFAAAIAGRNNLTVRAIGPEGDLVEDRIAESVVITRELSGELPETATLIEGAAQSRLELRGDARIESAPHPLRPTDQNTYLGSDIDIEAGYSGLTVPAFSGTVREFGFDEGSRGVSITARDAADRLAAPARVPLYGGSKHHVSTARAVKHLTNTQGVITSVLHGNDIRVTPRPRQGAVLSVPGVGGWLADIGWTFPGGGPTPADWLEAGRFGMMPKPSTETVIAHTSKPIMYAQSRWTQIEFFYRHQSGASKPRMLQFMVNTGGFHFSVEGNTISFNSARNYGQSTEQYRAGVTLTEGWHHICVKFGYGSGLWLWIDGAFRASDNTAWGSTYTPVSDYFDRVYILPGDIQGLLVHHAVGTDNLEAPPTDVLSFAPEADLDAGLLDLGVVPDVDGRVSWDVLKEIAAAELGMVGFSETGRFFFKNQATLQGGAAPVATWEYDFAAGVSGTVALDGIRSRASARVQRPELIESGFGAETEATTAIPSFLVDEVLTFPLGLSTHLLTGDKPFMPTTQRVSIISAPGAAWETGIGMVLCTGTQGPVRYTGSAVAAWLEPVSQSVWRLHVQNDSNQWLYAVWPAAAAWSSSPTPYGLQTGDGALWVLGVSLGDAAAEQVVESVRSATLATWGDRTLDLGSSPWRQDTGTAKQLLTQTLEGMSRPRVQLSDVSVPADPRWQLGDAVTLRDPDGLLPDVQARITRIKLTIAQGVEHGMVGTYSLRQI